MIIKITEKAKELFIEARKVKKVPDDFYLRIGVQKGGCMGIAHQLGFDEYKENDEIYSFNEIKVIIDRRHKSFLDGLIIDFTIIEESKKNLPFEGVSFENPNAVRVCGCGNSFNVI